MFAGIFSCTPSFSPEINKVYLILSYLILFARTRLNSLGIYVLIIAQFKLVSSGTIYKVRASLSLSSLN